MDIPIFFTTNVSVLCSDLSLNVVYHTGTHLELEESIQTILNGIIDGDHKPTSYNVSVDTICKKINDDAVLLVCLNDDECENVFAITNISNETKKYKEFNVNCELYIAPISANNVFYIPANSFHTIIGNGITKILQINLPSTAKFIDDKNKYKEVNIKQKLDFAFYNDLVYNSKLNLEYKEILKSNEIYKITTFSDKHQINVINDIAKLNDQSFQYNRFMNNVTLQNVFTSSICDWMLNELSKNDHKSTILVDPTKSTNVVSYLEYFINNTFLPEFSTFYDLPLESYNINIHGFVLDNILETSLEDDKRNLNVDFFMDTAITDIKGYHNFKDGTKRSLKKGDCIIYASNTKKSNIDIQNNLSYILKTMITVTLKNPNMKIVY